MNKKTFLPTVTSISICSLALSNCSTISNYRKDPSEWNNASNTKPKVEKTTTEKVVKKKQNGGFFSFITKYRADPKEWNKTETEPVASAIAKKPQPRATKAPSSQPRFVKQPEVKDTPTLPVEKIAKKESGVKKQRRQVGGLLAPDADKLPTKKDLQEIQSIVPKSSNSGGVNIPIKP